MSEIPRTYREVRDLVEARYLNARATLKPKRAREGVTSHVMQWVICRLDMCGREVELSGRCKSEEAAWRSAALRIENANQRERTRRTRCS